MTYVLGIDEAGYGPTLGPLVLGASLWRVVDAAPRDFWTALAPCVARPGERHPAALPVGDSKAVFDRGAGLCSLERPVLAFAAALGLDCTSVGGFLDGLVCGWRDRAGQFPWYSSLDRPLPTDPARSAFRAAGDALRDRMTSAGVACVGLTCEVVPAEFFNRRVAQTRNKAPVVSEHVLRLIQRAAERTCGSEMNVFVDRLGGRSDYRRLLQDAFPERRLEMRTATSRSSRYILRGERDAWTIEFAIDGDRDHLPIGLASMVAKYVRELFMAAFNEYWRSQVPNLRPTAGYAEDAQRFLREISPAAAAQGWAAEAFVRSR